MAKLYEQSGSQFGYSRMVVPADVRDTLGRCEFKEARREPTEAARTRAHGARLAEWKARIAAARASRRGAETSLTLRQIDALCGARYGEVLAAHGDDPGSAARWEREGEDAADLFTSDPSGSAYDFSPTPAVLDDARRYLAGQGIAADHETVRRFAERWAAERTWLADTMLRRLRGDWKPDPRLTRFPPRGDAAPAPPTPKPIQAAAPALTFTSLVDQWAAEAQVDKATVAKWRTAFAGLAASAGHDDAKRLTVDQVRTWKAARLGEGRKPKTVADGITGLRGVLGWGIRNGLLPAPNVFDGMAPRLSKRGEPPRCPYDDAEARAILSAARGEAGWRRWLPWLLAFTGARIGELADLQARDVRQDGETWILDVKPSGVNALKNPGSQRMIPVHPAVIQEGFLAYVAKLPADGSLWPDLPPGPDGSRDAPATGLHRRWVRDVVGITDPKKAPAHSWRHRMQDQGRIARMPDEALDALTGRTNARNAGAGYGRGWRGMPAELLVELSKVPSPLPVPAASSPPVAKAA